MLQEFSGEKLRALRKRSRLSQMQVVAMTGVSETTICYLEKGLRRPQERTLQKILVLYAGRIEYWKNVNRILNGEPHVEGKIDRQAPERR